MEKKKPTYDLASIKEEFATVRTLRMTRTARNGAFAMGMTLAEVVAVVQSIRRDHFYKSMTSFADHRVWQDVYHVPWEERVLYVKFTVDGHGKIIVSFKEK